MSSEGDDEWAQVRAEYATKAGPVSWIKRLPAHVLIMITVVVVVGAVLGAVVLNNPARNAHTAGVAKTSTQALAGQRHPIHKAAAPAKASVPPLTGVQKKEVEQLANQQAQQMAAAGTQFTCLLIQKVQI